MIAEVERTAAFLDEVLPGWEQRVTKPINFSHDRECVVGQASGSFNVFSRKHFHHRWREPRWFNDATCPPNDAHDACRVAWAAAIAARLHPSTDRAWIAAEPLHVSQRTLVRDLLARAGSTLTALLAVLG